MKISRKISIIITVVLMCLLGTIPASADEENRDDYIQCLEDIIAIKNKQIVVYQEQISGMESVAAPDVTIFIEGTYNPTTAQVESFLMVDDTDKNEWSSNYNCRHFTADINNRADAMGWRCAYVIVEYENGYTHAVVGFDTREGMIYVEPQTDKIIELQKGGTSWSPSPIVDWEVVW